MTDKNPAKETCIALPQPAYNYLKQIANRDLTNIQNTTNKIHNCFQKLSKTKLTQDQFNNQVENLLKETYNHIQDLSYINTAFPTLFTDDQATILNDLIRLTVDLNLATPNPASFTEYENGQIGGAATILQQQWAA